MTVWLSDRQNEIINHYSSEEGLTSGDRVGFRGRGFLGGLSLCGVWGDLGGAAGGLPAGRGGRTTLRPRGPPWGDGAGLRGRTMLTGWVPLGAGPGLRGRTSLLVWGSWDPNKDKNTRKKAKDDIKPVPNLLSLAAWDLSGASDTVWSQPFHWQVGKARFSLTYKTHQITESVPYRVFLGRLFSVFIYDHWGWSSECAVLIFMDWAIDPDDLSAR